METPWNWTPEQFRTFMDIIDQLNRKRQWHTDTLWDCGPIGVLRVYWGHYGWEGVWYDVSKYVSSQT
jgi:hypothetical protein